MRGTISVSIQASNLPAGTALSQANRHARKPMRLRKGGTLKRQAQVEVYILAESGDAKNEPPQAHNRHRNARKRLA